MRLCPALLHSSHKRRPLFLPPPGYFYHPHLWRGRPAWPKTGPHWHYERPTAEDLSYEAGHYILLRIRDPEMTRQRRARQELKARRAVDNTAREPCVWELQEEAQLTRD